MTRIYPIFQVSKGLLWITQHLQYIFILWRCTSCLLASESACIRTNGNLWQTILLSLITISLNVRYVHHLHFNLRREKLNCKIWHIISSLTEARQGLLYSILLWLLVVWKRFKVYQVAPFHTFQGPQGAII